MKSLSRRFLISVGLMSLIMTVLGTFGAFVVFERELSNRQIGYLTDYVRERSNNVDRQFSNLSSLQLPAPGEYALKLWLFDEAGNQDPRLAAPPVTLRYDDASPQLAFEARGFTAAHHGEGRWNGVAMLSRAPLEDVSFGCADGVEPDSEARLMTARSSRPHETFVPA